jgi:hypothetical protein
MKQSKAHGDMSDNPAKKIGKIAGSGPFESLLGRLVRVPKAEVETEERKYKAMRKRLKEKKAKRGKDGR